MTRAETIIRSLASAHALEAEAERASTGAEKLRLSQEAEAHRQLARETAIEIKAARQRLRRLLDGENPHEIYPPRPEP